MQMVKHKANPYFVQILEKIEDATNVYVIQEFCNGGNLHEFMKNMCRDMDLQVIWRIMQQMVLACNELKRVKIIHRDINLKNFWINFKSWDLDIILSKGRERELFLRNIDLNMVQFTIKLGGFRHAMTIVD